MTTTGGAGAGGDSAAQGAGKNGASTVNTAASGASVGIQAEHVHNSTVYQVLPDAPPSRKYEVGVRFLDDGVPSRARDLIGEAMAHGHESAEVRFHWVLAMLSKRSYRDLTPAERAQLNRASILRAYPEDEWQRALEAICDLLDCLEDSEDRTDSELALEKLLALDPRQRDKVIQHLDLVLTGGMRDAVWARTRQWAERTKDSGDRMNRVWAYFHPEPAEPRALRPEPDRSTTRGLLTAFLCSCTAAAAFGYLGWLLLVRPGPLPVLAFLVTLVAGGIGGHTALEWHCDAERSRVERNARTNRRRADLGGADKSFRKVHHDFAHYFNKYVPAGTDRAPWMAETVDIRNALRDEVAALYSAKEINGDRVGWLIRHLVGKTRKEWERGAIQANRERHRTTSALKVTCVLSLTVALAAAAGVVAAAVEVDVIRAVAATAITVVSGRIAVPRWRLAISERRRLAEAALVYAETLAEREEAHQQWRDRLHSTRPSEQEMETWLNCDKALALDEALRHYRLAWRDIIAHALLQTPARRYKRARVKGGPWRYSTYDIRLFLITHDGVREVSTELHFERAVRNGQQRNNFRFDAVSSVHVDRTDDLGHTLELTLMNGPTRDIRVTDPERAQSDSEESPESLAQMNLDAAGFVHTLHILEGIAAEGKGWIDRDPYSAGLQTAVASG